MLFFFSRPFHSFNAQFFLWRRCFNKLKNHFCKHLFTHDILLCIILPAPLRMNEKGTKKPKKQMKCSENNMLEVRTSGKILQVFCFVLFLFASQGVYYIGNDELHKHTHIHSAKAIARARAPVQARAGAIHHTICNINFVYRCWIKYRAYRYGKLVQFKDRITDLMTAHSYVVHKFHIIIHENHKNEVFVVYWRINGIDRIEQHLLLYRTI